MKIKLKLYAVLGQYLPSHAVKNEAEIDIDASRPLQGVLEDHGVPPENCHLVLVNGHYVAPSERAERILAEGDHLAVWPPVAGGC